VLFAELTSKPSTSAVMVAIIPALSFTISWASLFRWWRGNRVCSQTPSRAPPNVLTIVIKLNVIEFIVKS